jgi:bifunctional DNA-binding transcriptional regulator/antitoxin component of YhaV-PrlF toxin-antitoxin module
MPVPPGAMNAGASDRRVRLIAATTYQTLESTAVLRRGPDPGGGRPAVRRVHAPDRSARIRSAIQYLFIYPHLRFEADQIAIARSTPNHRRPMPANSIPRVRKKLGVGPGSVLEWEEQDDQIVVRRAGRYTSDDIYQVLFPQGAAKKGPVDVKEGVREYIRKRHARR